ncbi:MAG: DUF1887 family protein [Puniceicoccales bacterium]|nr:DUF1887 family protein [Puniceicoccales bacterium]
MSHSLIQIVSGQTLPNIFPALVLPHAEIVLLHTPGTVAQCGWIAKALEKAGVGVRIQKRVLSDSPGIEETGRATIDAISDARASGLAPIVNFTGGTKLMGIGAFVAAHQSKTPSFYLDAANDQFTDGRTGDLPLALRDHWKAVKTIRQMLNLDIVAAACGIESISPGRDPAPFLPLALHLRHNAGERDALLQAIDPKANPIFDPKKPEDVAQLLDTPVFDGVISEHAARLAADAGILEQRSGQWFFARPASLEKLEDWLQNEKPALPEWFAALAPLQTAINFFGGGWWELAVLDAARRAGIFSGIRWSVEVSIGGQTYEKDLIALENLNLAIFSCKRGGDKARRLVAAIEELDSTARHIGGSHARRYFCVACPISAERLAPIRMLAGHTNTILVGPASHLNPGSFAKPNHRPSL